MSISEMTVLRKHDKLRGGGDDPPTQTFVQYTPAAHTMQAGGGCCGGGGGGGANGGNGGNNNQHGGGMGGGNTPAAGGGKQNSKVVCPSAAALIGASTGGAVDKNVTCANKMCQDKKGHHATECPAAFAAQHPSKTMQGFDSTGQKDPRAWSSSEITAHAKVQWKMMQHMGFFTRSQHADGKTLPQF
eukprot:2894446-Rhodomonas_salina.1